MSDWSDWDKDDVTNALKTLEELSTQNCYDKHVAITTDESSDDEPLSKYLPVAPKVVHGNSDSSSDEVPLKLLVKRLNTDTSSLESLSDDPKDPDFCPSETDTETEEVIACSQSVHQSSETDALQNALLESKKGHALLQVAVKWHTKRLNSLLQARNMKISPVAKDGDCFFRSMLTALNEDNLNITELRRRVYDHLVNHYDHYKAFLLISTKEEYQTKVNCIKTTGYWSEDTAHLLPLAIANIYGQPIIILTSRHTRQIINISPSLPCDHVKEPVTIAYTCVPGREHYDPCVIADATSTSSSHQDQVQEQFATPKKRNEGPESAETPRKSANYTSPKHMKLTRKRKNTPENWKKVVRKRCRLQGKSYLNTCGKQVSEKTQNVKDCSGCAYKCSEKVSKENCAQLFENFWQMGSYERQCDFILNNIQEKKTKIQKSFKQGKSVHRIYSFVVDDERVKVCKGFFLSTLAISEKKIRVALEKKRSGDHTQRDKRGRHEPYNKTPDDLLTRVREHIESFPTVSSHYTRKNSVRKYLAADLSINTMYNLYKSGCTDDGTKPVSEHIYRRVFNTEYNLYFFKPKKDQCVLCNQYQQNPTDAVLKVKYEEHQVMKEEARKEKEIAKEIAKKHPEIHAATFDLQAVLTTPCSLVSQVYYKRKLCSYNLSFYSLGNQKGTCYLWNECHGARGSSEIATCLLLYLKSLPSQVKYVTFFSDNCTGQNRNKYVAAALHYSVTSIPNLEVVEQKFLETGHTQMECDSMHASIEKAKKKTSIFEPSQWDTIIQMARKSNPYVAKPLSYKEFLDFQDYACSNFKNLVFDTDGKRVSWMTIRVLQVRKEEPGKMYLKYDYRDDTFVCINTNRSKQRGRPSDAGAITRSRPGQKYFTKLEISDKKKKDLLSLCASGVIPEVHHQFYHNLPSSGAVLDRLPEPDILEEDDEMNA